MAIISAKNFAKWKIKFYYQTERLILFVCLLLKLLTDWFMVWHLLGVRTVSILNTNQSWYENAFGGCYLGEWDENL